MDIEREDEARVALQTTDHEDKNAEVNGNITMADTVKDTTSTKATLVTDKDPSAIWIDQEASHWQPGFQFSFFSK